MSAGFTSGPWAVEGDGYSTSVYAVNGRHYKVCADIDLNGNPENQANANLIAAAPELYEALELSVAALRDYVLDVDSEPTPAHRDLMSKADKALSRARGETISTLEGEGL